MGRWARICYYNGFQIAWISGFNFNAATRIDCRNERRELEVDSYSVSLYFPTSSNDGGGHAGKTFKSLDSAKQYTEQIFLEFKQLINAK